MYAIIDIEGTGGKFNEEGITEIAIYKFDGHEIVDQFSSLVNPERDIDPYVTKLTGINRKMLVRAPKFYELAKRIIEITEDCVIVAHNAEFDLRMLQLEFDRLGYEYNRTTLCTVELSQKLLPDLESYSLGKLVRSLGIPITDRHRATGDALATVKLFQLLLNKDVDQNITKQSFRRKERTYLPKNLKTLIDDTPSVTGVYFIYDANDELVFIGKGKNVKSQLNRHFTKPNRLNKTITKVVKDVSVEYTGSELVATIKEHESIKKNAPRYNKKRRSHLFNHGLRLIRDEENFLQAEIVKAQRNNEYLLTFSSRKAGLTYLENLCIKYDICLERTNVDIPCPKCNGSLCELDQDHHNETMETLFSSKSILGKSGVIKTRGREATETGVIWIEKGTVQGYGFTNLKIQVVDHKILKNIITPVKHTKDSRHIVEQYMRAQKRYKLQEVE